MSLLKLIRNENFKPTVKPGSAFPIEKRAVIEDGIPTIRFWKKGSPFLTIKEEGAVIAKFEAVLRKHWESVPEPEIATGVARTKLESLLNR